MTQQVIDKKSFVSRLTALCVRGALRSLPRKQSDRAILLMSIVQCLESDREYTQAAINECIQAWLLTVAPTLGADHVTLRRCLVDEGFLEREADGTTYRLACRPPGAIGFAPDVTGLDIQGVVEAARREVVARRARYTRCRGIPE